MPLPGCEVIVHDDVGNIYPFVESSTAGIYKSDTNTFKAVVGRIYTLHINTNNATPNHYSYESEPAEMKPVPPIDSLFYEKVLIREATPESVAQEGCQIYLNTHDPDGRCRFYRWDYTETWEIEIPYDVTNKVCWVSQNSEKINIKNTAVLSQDMITCHPITFISNESDRLAIRYCINVSQLSMSENEFTFWDKFRNVTEDVGGLYDIIPFSTAGNIFCIQDPNERVLGYFSVSAKSSKRIYIDESFSGLANIYYPVCLGKPISEWDTCSNGKNEWWWIIEYYGSYITFQKWCQDCTARGTIIRPEFWKDFK